MKKIILSLILMSMSVIAYADMDGYNGGTTIFPDEKTTQGLPEAIPCVLDQSLNCTWWRFKRKINYIDQQGNSAWYWNHSTGRCLRGKCMYGDGSGQSGIAKADVPFTLSVWYVIGESTDGKPVAYRNDKTPWGTGGKAVSYAESGAILKTFYEDSGVSDKGIQEMFSMKYQGGWKQFLADQGGAKPTAVASTGGNAVFEAHCAPQLDDSCTVNNVKVPKDELGKYLPAVKDTNIEAKGGYCEYPICYNAQDKPIGIRE